VANTIVIEVIAIVIMEQVTACIRELLLTDSDTFDEAKARMVLTLLQQRKKLMSPAFELMRSAALRGGRKSLFQCLRLIDFLFHNGNRDLLAALQASPSVLALGKDPVIGDPLFHHTLCQHAWSWQQCLDAARVLTPRFDEWRAHLFAFRFRYILTQKVADKFCADFATAFELLSIFSEAIVAASLEGGSRDEVGEILPNVAEVHQRLRELRPWMVEPYLVSVIDYLLADCELCRAGYTRLASGEQVDIEALAEIAGRGIPQPPNRLLPAPVQSPYAVQPQQPPPGLRATQQQPVVTRSPPQPGGQQQAVRATQAPYPQQPAAPSGRGTQQQAAPAKPPGSQSAPPKTDLGFDCDDDVSDDGLSNAEFAAFVDTLSGRKR
jgi:hypothetical protein